MTELQTGLIGLGVAAVVGVAAYNKWQEYRHRKLAEQVTTFQPGIKRLFVSGYPADFIAHQGVLDAGVHFLQKPFSFRTLAMKVQEVLAEHQKGECLPSEDRR